jgi:hypothetical protein
MLGWHGPACMPLNLVQLVHTNKLNCTKSQGDGTQPSVAAQVAECSPSQRRPVAAMFRWPAPDEGMNIRLGPLLCSTKQLVLCLQRHSLCTTTAAHAHAAAGRTRCIPCWSVLACAGRHVSYLGAEAGCDAMAAAATVLPDRMMGRKPPHAPISCRAKWCSQLQSKRDAERLHFTFRVRYP